jgi:hypothetical protein
MIARVLFGVLSGSSSSLLSHTNTKSLLLLLNIFPDKIELKHKLREPSLPETNSHPVQYQIHTPKTCHITIQQHHRPTMGASHSNTTTTIVTAKHKDTSIQQKFKAPQQGPYEQYTYKQEAPKLKGILKNKDAVKSETIQKPVKIVELYAQRGEQWTVTRVREVSAVGAF